MERPLPVARHAIRDFVQDRMAFHAASLAFYGLLAAVPLFAVAIIGASFVLGAGDDARAGLESGANALLGDERAKALQTLIQDTTPGDASIAALVFSVALLLFAASRLFAVLGGAMNVVWDVKAEPERGWRKLARKRFASFAMILGVGLLLLVSLGASNLAGAILPEIVLAWEAARLLVAALLSWAVLGLLYWKLPDAEVEPRDAWRGAALIAVLFALGERAMGWLLGGEHLTIVYGSLASVVVALLWFYYTSLIVLGGAELAHALAASRGEKPPAEDIARPRGEKRPAPR